MHSRTSLYRFVRKHVVRHAQSGRQNLAIQSSLLLDPPAGLVQRALGRAAHVLCAQCFGRDDRARLDEPSRCLMQELAAQVADALVQLRYLLAQPLIANGAALFPRLLSLQISHTWHLVAHESRIVDRLAVIERGPVGQPEVDAAMVLTRAGAGAGVFRNAQRDRGEPLPVLARDRQIVGLRALAKPVLASGTDRHRILAATDANRRSTRAVLCQFPARRIRITEARKPPAGLKAREPGRLPGFDAAKERLKRQIELAQGLLQRVTAELDELRTGRLDLWQRVLLVVVADRLPGLAICVDALLQRGVVELTVQADPRREAFGLACVGVELEGDFAAFHDGEASTRKPMVWAAVDAQGTEEHAQKSAGKGKAKPARLTPSFYEFYERSAFALGSQANRPLEQGGMRGHLFINIRRQHDENPHRRMRRMPCRRDAGRLRRFIVE